jgi:hypothetical protein
MDEARKQVFKMSAELLAANDGVAILEGLHQRRDFQETMEANINTGRNKTCLWVFRKYRKSID